MMITAAPYLPRTRIFVVPFSLHSGVFGGCSSIVFGKPVKLGLGPAADQLLLSMNVSPRKPLYSSRFSLIDACPGSSGRAKLARDLQESLQRLGSSSSSGGAFYPGLGLI
jgi:hypothetical protein